VKLADGKERTLRHIAATTFWGRDGNPLSAAQFVEQLFGDLPALFKNEEELRTLWGRPDTRKKLLDGLADKGYGTEQLAEIGTLIEAEKSDLYDVLAYIAFALPPVTRAERVASRRPDIVKGYEYPQQEFLNFVLGHYVERGVGELDLEKLPQLLELKYQTFPDAVAQLGRPENIREVFVGFQERLY
jgi:type I restriction enzyme R subunit